MQMCPEHCGMCLCFAVFHPKNTITDKIDIILCYALHILGLLLRRKVFAIE